MSVPFRPPSPLNSSPSPSHVSTASWTVSPWGFCPGQRLLLLKCPLSPSHCHLTCPALHGSPALSSGPPGAHAPVLSGPFAATLFLSLLTSVGTVENAPLPASSPSALMVLASSSAAIFSGPSTAAQRLWDKGPHSLVGHPSPPSLVPRNSSQHRSRGFPRRSQSRLSPSRPCCREGCRGSSPHLTGCPSTSCTCRPEKAFPMSPAGRGMKVAGEPRL